MINLVSWTRPREREGDGFLWQICRVYIERVHFEIIIVVQEFDYRRVERVGMAGCMYRGGGGLGSAVEGAAVPCLPSARQPTAPPPAHQRASRHFDSPPQPRWHHRRPAETLLQPVDFIAVPSLSLSRSLSLSSPAASISTLSMSSSSSSLSSTRSRLNKSQLRKHLEVPTHRPGRILVPTRVLTHLRFSTLSRCSRSLRHCHCHHPSLVRDHPYQVDR